METYEQIVTELNHSLNKEQFNKNEIENIIVLAMEQTKLKLKLFDFEYFNENKLAEIQTIMAKALETENFEQIAYLQQIENECIRIITVREKCELKESVFSTDEDSLLYFYFGNSTNDKVIKSLFTDIIKKDYP